MELLEYLKRNSVDFEKTKKGIEVGGYLDLRGTQITSLPDNLKSKAKIKIENKGRWSVYISKNNIRIGCESKSKTGWKEFFKKKQFISTNPEYYPEDYKAIEDDFKTACELQKQFFKKK